MIRFAELPPRTFAEPGNALMAEIYEWVVINLPTNPASHGEAQRDLPVEARARSRRSVPGLGESGRDL